MNNKIKKKKTFLLGRDKEKKITLQ
jgi:hypothetical protein